MDTKRRSTEHAKKFLVSSKRPYIKKTLAPQFEEYKINGELEAVFRTIATIFSKYDAMTFGTKVRSIEKEVDGTYTARVWRAGSSLEQIPIIPDIKERLS